MHATIKKSPDRLNLLYLVAMALPFVIYALIINHYAINIPYFDDFSVLLWPMNNIYSTGLHEVYVRQLFNQNGGHIPLITRLVVLLEFKTLGEIDFRLAVLLGNAGWLLTTFMLITYFRKKLQLGWAYFVPVPFLMLTINHWEAMDFTTPAWQMYWGSSFFSVLCLLSIVERRMTLAVYAFTAALFLSSGSLSLIPLTLGYCIIRKRWGDALQFLIRIIAPLAVFFYFNPPANSLTTLPGFPVMVKYVLGFMGNLVANGTWNLANIAWIQIPLGIVVIASGLYMLAKCTGNDLSKLLFVYVIILSGMALYLRSSIFPYTVSRYALYASLAVTAIYIAFAVQANRTAWKWFKPVATTCAILLWMHSIYICRAPMQYNRDSRIEAVKAYLHTDIDPDAFPALLWDFHFGKSVLLRSMELHIYDIYHGKTDEE
ncbi:MAG TPA: hypothetical protein PLF22_01120 [Pseudomonadales bacterium]|nr:hypothetical protein [Pseudomonadales bacterium]